MASDPLVSVLLPVLDAGAYLQAALDGIAAQTYANIELILVDDGSTDDTLAIAKRFSGQKTRIVSRRNEGVGASINDAMALAEGTIIALHGGDDVSHPDRIARQVALLVDDATDISTCRPAIIDGAAETLESKAFPVFDRVLTDGAPYDIFFELFYGRNFLCAPGAAFTRATWERVGPVHAGLLQMQDFDFWLRAAALGLRFHIDQKPFLSYRFHDKNVSSLANLRRGLRELGLVYRAIAPRIDLALGTALLARNREFGPIVQGAPSVEIIRPFLFLSHEDESIRQIGFEMLLALLADSSTAAALERHFGVTRRKAFAMVLDRP